MAFGQKKRGLVGGTSSFLIPLLFLCFVAAGLCCEFRDLHSPQTMGGDDSEIEIIEVTIYFTGAQPDCQDCSENPALTGTSFSYSATSACGNKDNTWSLGDWSGGNGTYVDPVPLGSSVVGASMELWGYWDFQPETEGLFVVFCCLLPFCFVCSHNNNNNRGGVFRWYIPWSLALSHGAESILPELYDFFSSAAVFF